MIANKTHIIPAIIYNLMGHKDKKKTNKINVSGYDSTKEKSITKERYHVQYLQFPGQGRLL